jgi:hypothetical protein
MQRLTVGIALLAVLAAPGRTPAEDAWDITSSGDDDGPGTDSELAPGSSEVHDMEAVGALEDADWFIVSRKAYSSYEVVVDGLTECLAFVQSGQTTVPLTLELVQSDGALLNGSTPLGSSGSARSLIFRNEGPTPLDDGFVRVADPFCGTTCTTFEQYKIHFHDTTCTFPRYNNSASQISIMILQNASPGIVLVGAHFFDSAGTHLAAHFAPIPAFGTYVVNTSTIPGLAGTGGSVLVTNGARYGTLSGKMVAVEPATGFTFDTALQARLE